MAWDGKRWLLCSVLFTACVADDRSSRPPLIPPAPPQDVITVGGFDDAMHIGSDYIYASKLPDRVFMGSQELLRAGRKRRRAGGPRHRRQVRQGGTRGPLRGVGRSRVEGHARAACAGHALHPGKVTAPAPVRILSMREARVARGAPGGA